MSALLDSQFSFTLNLTSPTAPPNATVSIDKFKLAAGLSSSLDGGFTLGLVRGQIVDGSVDANFVVERVGSVWNTVGSLDVELPLEVRMLTFIISKITHF